MSRLWRLIHGQFTPEIAGGKQIAVAGTVSLYLPGNHCSILLEEAPTIEEDGSKRFDKMIPVRLCIALAAMLALVLVPGGFLLLTSAERQEGQKRTGTPSIDNTTTTSR